MSVVLDWKKNLFLKQNFFALQVVLLPPLSYDINAIWFR